MESKLTLADVEAELTRRGLDQASLDAQILRKADQTGAPSRIRALVGGFEGEDKINVLRQFYPDAEPVGIDNFVFTNPETGKLTVYNPKGLDFADVASVTKDILKAGGGAIGAAVGATGGAVGGSVVPGPGTVAGATAGAIGGSALGTAAGAALFDAFVPLSGLDDPRSLGSRAADLGMSGVEGAAGQAGGVAAGAVLREGTKAAVRGLSTGADKVAQAISDFAPTGAVPSAGVATGSRFIQGAESALSKFAGSAGVMAKAAKETAGKIEESVSNIAGKMGDELDKTRLGSFLQRGIEGPNGFMKKFELVQKNLYAPVDKAIKDDVKVTLSATDAALKEIMGSSELSKTVAPDLLKRIQAALAKDGGIVPYADLKDFRSIVGKKLSGGSLVPGDLARQQWSQLYAALSDDTRAVAQAAGVGKELADATKHSKAGYQRIETFLDDLVKKAEPEKAVDYALAGTEQGATRLNAIYKSLGDDEKGALSAYVLRGLGTPKPGAATAETTFSPETFLTNWNKLSPQTKDVLFGNERFKSYAADLDKISASIGKLREAGGAFKNPSGTAGATTAAQTITGLGSGATGLMLGEPSILIGVLTSAGGANLSARLLTNPGFVKWLAKSTEIAPNGLGAHIGRLSAVAAASDSESKQAIKEYLGLIGARDERAE